MAARSRAKKQSRKTQEAPSAEELLVLELQQIHSAENQLARQLPRLTKAVQSQMLRKLCEQRLEEGERIIKDIETALEELEETPGRRRNVAAEGLINDAREHVQELEQGPALDAVLIGDMQKTEHYCIAAWGTARSLAQALGQSTARRAMDRALKEGGPFDQRLTDLSEREVTPALLSEESQSEDDEDESGGSSGGRRTRSARDRGSEDRAAR